MKKFIALLTALIMVFALCACEANVDTPAATETATEPTATESTAEATNPVAGMKVAYIMDLTSATIFQMWKDSCAKLCDALDVANDKEKIVYGLQYVGRTLGCMFDWIVVKYQQQQYRWIIETLALRDVTIGKIIFVSDVMRHFFCQHKGKVYIEDGDHAHCCDLDCHSTAAYEWLEDGIPACAVGPRNGCQHSLITDPFTAMKSLK